MTTCLENVEMSGNLTVVREMSGIFKNKSRKCQGKILSGKKLPKTVYYELHTCVHTGIC